MFTSKHWPRFFLLTDPVCSLFTFGYLWLLDTFEHEFDAFDKIESLLPLASQITLHLRMQFAFLTQSAFDFANETRIYSKFKQNSL